MMSSLFVFTAKVIATKIPKLTTVLDGTVSTVNRTVSS